MSLRKLLNPDADTPLYRFKPQPDITLAELAQIVAGMLADPIRIRDDKISEQVKRHFERVKD